jgi:hypothetical protein
MADGVSRAISSRAPIVTFYRGDLNFHFGDYSHFSPGQCVVLLVNRVLTGRTTTAILRVLRRMEAVPVAVATVIDGREDFRKPIETFDGPVIVVSCLAQALVVPMKDLDQAQIVDIDPPKVGVSAERGPIPRAMASSTFVSWLRAADGAGVFIGHIDRGPSRHFSTYLNVGRLIEPHPEAVTAVIDNLKAALLPDAPPRDRVTVIYPTIQGNYAKVLAEAVSQGLSPALGYSVPCVPARRQPDGTWEPLSVPFSPYTAAILDWGAVTSTTIRVLMSLAARSGATRIHAVTLTSQLSEEAEWQLRTIGSIREELPLSSAPNAIAPANLALFDTVQVTVPVTSAMLSRVPMGISDTTHCLLCRVAQQLRRDALEAPTTLLRAHAQAKFERYRPRQISEVIHSVAVDLAGEPLTVAAAADVWAVHQLLEDARTSTSARTRIRTEIEGWVGEGLTSSMQAWIRLLVVEAYWLNGEPLAAFDLRKHIGRVCVDIVCGAISPPASSGMRWQAVLVLRSASRRVFIDAFSTLVAASVNDEMVARELMLSMYTLLQRPYNHGPEMMERAVVSIRDASEELTKGSRTDPGSRDLALTATAIFRQALEIRGRTSNRDALVAWHSLQASYISPMRNHQGKLDAINTVVNAFRPPSDGPNPAAIRDADYWRNIGERWTECCDFLAARVFPYLRAVRDLLESLESAPGAAPNRLVTFDSRRAERLTANIANLERHPEAFTQDVRVQLASEANEWLEALLREPGQPSGVVTQKFVGARLLRLAEQNPCDLAIAWERALKRARDADLRVARVLGRIPEGTLVFCSLPLLIDLLGQVIHNASFKHAAPDRPKDGVNVRLGLTTTDQIAELEVLNDWSLRHDRRAGGLAALNDSLHLYGGDILHEAVGGGSADLSGEGAQAEAAWTYRVVIRLRRWTAEGERA